MSKSNENKDKMFDFYKDIERRVIAKAIEELKVNAKIEKMSAEDLKPLLNVQN